MPANYIDGKVYKKRLDLSGLKIGLGLSDFYKIVQNIFPDSDIKNAENLAQTLFEAYKNEVGLIDFDTCGSSPIKATTNSEVRKFKREDYEKSRNVIPDEYYPSKQ